MLSDREYFVAYLQNKALIRSCFNWLCHTQFPARSPEEKEDRWSDLILSLKDRQVFEGYDPNRGDFDKYILWSVKSILSHMYAKASRRSQVIFSERSVERPSNAKGETNDVSPLQRLCDIHRKTSPNQSTNDLRQEIDALMSSEELEILSGMVDSDLSGGEIAEAMGTYDMAISRKIKAIRNKVRKYVAVQGIA